MISFVTSANAMYSASVDDRVTLLIDYDFQDIKAPQKYKIHPKKLICAS
jgi:hypothetical protein